MPEQILNHLKICELSDLSAPFQFSKRKASAEFKRPLYCVLTNSLAFVSWLGFPSQHANDAFIGETLQLMLEWQLSIFCIDTSSHHCHL